MQVKWWFDFDIKLVF